MTRRPWSLAAAVLVVALAIDAVFIVIDATAGAASDFPAELHVYEEGGIPEWFLYAKFVAAGILMFVLARTTVAVYAVWGAVFMYLFVDDALMLHERVAGHSVRLLPLDDWFDLPFEAWVVIEPLYMVGVGVAILVALWYVAKRSSTAVARRFTVELLVLLVALGVFASVGDFVGNFIFDRARLAEIVEDGGEMVIASFMLGRVIYQFHGERHVRGSVIP